MKSDSSSFVDFAMYQAQSLLNIAVGHKMRGTWQLECHRFEDQYSGYGTYTIGTTADNQVTFTSPSAGWFWAGNAFATVSGILVASGSSLRGDLTGPKGTPVGTIHIRSEGLGLVSRFSPVNEAIEGRTK